MTQSNFINVVCSTEDVFRLPSATLMPQANNESFDSFCSSKDYAKNKHARNKADSSRFNVKEKRGRNCQRRDKWLRDVVQADKDRKKIVPHAMNDVTGSLEKFVQEFTSFIEMSPAANSSAAQAIFHVENLAILIYNLVHSKSLDNYIVAIISYMKCYVKTSLVVLVSEVHRLIMTKPHPCHSEEQRAKEHETILLNTAKDMWKLETGIYNDNLARIMTELDYKKVKEEVKENAKLAEKNRRLQNTEAFNIVACNIDSYLQNNCKPDPEEVMKQKQAEDLNKMFMSEQEEDVLPLYEEDSIDSDGKPVEEISVPHDSCEPHAMNVQSIKDAWDMIKTNPIFEKVSYLLTAAMASSVCSFKEINFELAGVKLIHLEAMKQQVNSFDIIDALISTFTWIVETGSACIAERSLAPILFADQRLKEYSRACAETIALAGSAVAGNVPDLQLYERKLDGLLEETRRIIDVTKSVPIKEMLSKKYIVLRGIKVDLINKHKNTQYRFAPIGFSLFGESSIGKSDVAELTMKTALEAMGEDSSKKGIFTLNDADKYESQYTTDVKGVFIDDANNTASGFVEGAPTARFFRFFNNMSSTALKPDVDSKGNVFIEFKVGVLTTNTKSLGANIYSNYPISILRRFYHVTVEVKEKYRVPGGTSLNVNHPELINAPSDQIVDVWEFSVEEAIPDGTSMGTFRALRFVDDNGESKKVHKVDLRTYLKIVANLSRQHKVRQDKQVFRNTHLESISCCKRCVMIPQFCNCPQSLSEIFNLLNGTISSAIFKLFQEWLSRKLGHYIIDAAHLISPTSEEFAVFFDEQRLPRTLQWLPSWITTHEVFRGMIFTYHLNKKNPNVTNIRKTTVKLLWFFGLLFILGNRLLSMWTLVFILFLLLHLVLLLMMCDLNIHHERNFVEHLFNEHSGRALAAYGRTLRTTWQAKALGTAAGLVTIMWVLKAWNFSRKSPHALTDPRDIDLRPSWFGFTMNEKKAHCSSGVKGAVAMQVSSRLDMNLCWGRFTHPDGFVNKCCVFHPRKSVILFPRHIFHRDSNMKRKPSEWIECQISRNNTPGGTYKCIFRYDMVYHFPDMDMVAAFVPNCPDYRDATKWFVKDQPVGNAVVHISTITEDGERFNITTNALFGKVKHTFMSMMGASYKSDICSNGSCMSVLVSESVSPAIVGFHIGGNSLSHTGISCTITKEQYYKAEKWLEENIAFLSAHATEIPETQYGKPIVVSEEVNPKCKYVVERQNDPSASFEIIGSSALRAEMKSKVKKSILSDHITEVFGVPNDYGPPKLRPNWKPFMANLDALSNPVGLFDPKLLQRSVEDYLEPLVDKMLKYKTFDIMRPLTMKESILGVPGKRFLDPLPMNTGVGFPLFGKKNKTDVDGNPLYFKDEWLDGVLVDRVPLPIIEEEVNRLLNCYRNNKRAYPVTTASLKDEPTPMDKEKVRVFQAAAIALSILIRKYFLPIARFMCTYPLLAECAVGINAFSQDWQELMDHILRFAEDGKVLAWDFKQYDIRMSSQMTRQAWSIFIYLAQIGGYDEESLQIMKAMIVDITHPLIDMNGTMIMTTSMNTSGNNMTVMVNSVVNCLYLRMGFFTIYPELKDFRKFVGYTSYGDDGLGSNSRPKTEKFNFATYQKFLADHGITLTVPTKTDDIVDFLELADADFLKRTSNYIPEIGCKIGKLDENSILKSLHSNIASTAVTPIEQAASCVECALHEYFAYGREIYEERRKQLSEVCVRAKVPVSALDITFDERVNHWKEKYITAEDTSEFSSVVQQKSILYLENGSVEKTATTNLPDLTETHLIGRSNSLAHERKLGVNEFNSPAGRKALFPTKPQCASDFLTIHEKIKIYDNVELLDVYMRELENNNFESPVVRHFGDLFSELPYCEWFNMSEYDKRVLIHDVYHYFRANGIYAGLHKLIEDNILPDNVFPQAASEEISGGSQADSALDTANIQFHDAHAGYLDTRGAVNDPLREALHDESVSLDNFFARPIKIVELQWDINTFLHNTFDPWSLYFNNKRVINRISNFRLLKAELHVKVVCNGTSLHYGRALVSYYPLPIWDVLTRLTPGSFRDIMAASIRPHFYVNPTISQGGSMLLPFFFPYNFLDTAISQWDQMGRMTFSSLTDLKHANAGTSPVTISVFAWAENVQLSGLTQQDPFTIVPQAESEYSGIISKPVSTIAKYANMLTKVPKIARFARATQMGAESVAEMANFFGYSKPPAQHQSNFTPVPTHAIVNSDGRDSLVKMSVDSKQELTVDPAVCGLDSKDEMTIHSIASRETIISSFLWPTTATSEFLLYNIIVDPCVMAPVVDKTSEIRMTALGHATFPFNYWRGSLKYRFQVCGSAFHKGRLKVVWDPFAAFAVSEYNMAYTHIVDIAEKNDFTIQVGWGQATSWRHPLGLDQPIGYAFDFCDGVAPAARVTYNGANLANIGNGVLSVYVVNPLATPNSSINNDIRVFVSISAGDDFEVAAPRESTRSLMLRPYADPAAAHASSGGLALSPQLLTFPGLLPQTLSAPLELESISEEIEPQAATETEMNLDNPIQNSDDAIVYLGNGCQASDVANLIHMGETLVSFRALLKRYAFHEALCFRSNSASAHVRLAWARRNFPFDAGPVVGTPSAFNLIVNTTAGPLRYGKFTLLNYMACAYGAWRGGIRYMLDTSNLNTRQNGITVLADMLNSNERNDNFSEYDDGPTIIPDTLNGIRAISFVNVSTTQVFSTYVNPMCTVEIPYQSAFRFVPARSGSRLTKDPFQSTWEYEMVGTTSNAPRNYCPKFVAAGEDFGLYFYLGPPTFYRRAEDF